MAIHSRLVIQQCLSAQLKMTAGDCENIVKIGRGMVVYVCFMQGAVESMVEKIATSITTLRLSEDDCGTRKSILELPGDILVIQQATLGGKIKGKSVQYHSIVEKVQGERLFHQLVGQVKDSSTKSAKWMEKGCVVQNGVFGERQVLSMDTNGPFTHICEF